MRISDWSSDVCSSDLFDYPDQGVLYVPKALPLPSDRYFNEKFVDVLMPLIRSSSGGVLVLCTTLRAVDRIAELFEERFEDEAIDRPLLRQGESSRRALLERFRAASNAVLVGSASFWEGIEVPGQALTFRSERRRVGKEGVST